MIAGGVGGGPTPEVAPREISQEEEGPVIRLDFEIDPHEGQLRGAIVAAPSRKVGERLEYTPTRDLVHRWKKKRAAQKQQRKLQRVAKRERKKG